MPKPLKGGFKENPAPTRSLNKRRASVRTASRTPSIEPNLEKMALTPQPNAEDKLRAVSAVVPPFLTMSIATASIFSFVTLVGRAIIKPMFRYDSLQKYGKQAHISRNLPQCPYNCPHQIFVSEWIIHYFCIQIDIQER